MVSLERIFKCFTFTVKILFMRLPLLFIFSQQKSIFVIMTKRNIKEFKILKYPWDVEERKKHLCHTVTTRLPFINILLLPKGDGRKKQQHGKPRFVMKTLSKQHQKMWFVKVAIIANIAQGTTNIDVSYFPFLPALALKILERHRGPKTWVAR